MNLLLAWLLVAVASAPLLALVWAVLRLAAWADAAAGAVCAPPRRRVVRRPDGSLVGVYYLSSVAGVRHHHPATRA